MSSIDQRQEKLGNASDRVVQNVVQRVGMANGRGFDGRWERQVWMSIYVHYVEIREGQTALTNGLNVAVAVVACVGNRHVVVMLQSFNTHEVNQW